METEGTFRNREFLGQTSTNKEFNLSDKIVNNRFIMDEGLGNLKVKFKVKDIKEKIQNAQRRIKEINKLKFPLGCGKNMRDETTICGDISFGNKIILCDNCTQELIEKFGDKFDGEINKIFKEEFGEKLT